MRRRFILLGIDLFWVAVSPLVALFFRHHFAAPAAVLSAVIQYAVIGLLVGGVMIPLAGLNRGLWRYTSLPDLLRLLVAVTAIILLTLFATFALSRLADVPRSLPAMQWFILLAGMAGSRLAIRVWHERRSGAGNLPSTGESQNVLIVGVNPVAELYLRSVADFAPQTISVMGLLASGTDLSGRLLRAHKVLGRPEDLTGVLRQLEVHGSPIDRVIVVEPPARLSSRAVEALLNLERATTIKVDWIQELLGFGFKTGHSNSPVVAPHDKANGFHALDATAPELSIGSYRRRKRAIDLVGAVFLVVALSPIAAIVAALVAFDVGLPAVFWQKRPGRHGQPFKLYKFRTMRGAHDRQGNRIPDSERSSKIGIWLRRTRLDELPQLYNILVGEMSFVGPRPLLPCDQPDITASRLSVRPGLTGLAQVHGARAMSADDKNALDIWYIRNASLWLDTEVMLRTLLVLARGERVDVKLVQAAREAIKLKLNNQTEPDARGAAGNAAVEMLHSTG